MIGTLGKILEWRNKSGFYFWALGQKWKYYGKPKFEPGTTVEFEEGERGKDGVKLALNLRQPKEIAGAIHKFADVSHPSLMRELKQRIADNHIAEIRIEGQNREGKSAKTLELAKMFNDKDATITRLACLKAAATAFSGNVQFIKLKENETLIDAIIYATRRFEKYARGEI